MTEVENNIRARRLFRRGQKILVAVSGGLDSMVLLHVLYELAKKNRWRLTVAHLNHQLRGRSSDADERLVKRTAARLKVPAIIERARVRAFARAHKLSLEMAARTLRHDCLARTAARLGIRSIALAHHADDRIELFFLRLFRGSGGLGLAGMKWRNPSPHNQRLEIVRPLFDQPKAALARYAAMKKIRFREDASNAWLEIQRNRIRHELLPLLRKSYQPALDKTLPRMMDIVAAEAEFVMQAALDWLEGAARKRHGPQPAAFDELPAAVQRQCLQLQLFEQGIAPNYDLIERLRLAPEQPVTISRAARAAQDNKKEPSVFQQVVRDPAGLVHLQDLLPATFTGASKPVELTQRAGALVFDGVRVKWRIVPNNAARRPKRRPRMEVFDADKVGSRILLRHWQPGDRFQPIGMGSAIKLQDFFTNEKVPRQRRHELIVAANAKGEIFWVEGLRISERFKLAKDTIRRLQWRWGGL